MSEPSTSASPTSTEQLLSSQLPSATRTVWENLGFPEGKFRTSLGVLFPDAFFGRDTSTVLLHLMPYFRSEPDQEIYRAVLTGHLRVQALDHNPRTEAEPGKFHHELRSLNIWGTPISDASRAILSDLGPKFGGTQEFFCYYGSTDATPLGVRAICEYCRLFGDGFLDERVTRTDGRRVRVEEGLRLGIDWIVRSLALSDAGLLEFRCSNRDAALNQAWQDSHIAYLHPDGTLANHEVINVVDPRTGERFGRAQPIASTEVQGLAYAALKAAAGLFENRDLYYARGLERQAQLLQAAAIQQLWMPEERYFAMGLDRDADGQPRQIRTITSSAAEILGSGIFDGWDAARVPLGRCGLPDTEECIAGLLRKVFSEADLLCRVGLRCRSLRHAAALDPLLGFADYHGHYASWPKQGHDLAEGLRSIGMPRLAAQLDLRILNAVNVAHGYYELFYLNTDGHPVYWPDLPLSCCEEGVPAATLPEKAQAWTVSGVRAFKKSLSSGGARPAREPWIRALEDKVLASIPCEQAMTAAEIQEVRRNAPKIGLILGAPGSYERDFMMGALPP